MWGMHGEGHQSFDGRQAGGGGGPRGTDKERGQSSEPGRGDSMMSDESAGQARQAPRKPRVAIFLTSLS